MKKLNIIICILLLAAIPIGVFALTQTESAPPSAPFSRTAVDRIDVSVSETEFYPEINDDGVYSISFEIRIKKTQADFYAFLNSLKITGLEYDSAVFTPLNENCDGLSMDSLLLPVKDNEPAEVAYRVEVTFHDDFHDPIFPSLVLDYTSGMTRLTSEKHILDIPLTIIFN